jgi:hypothetical protein
MERMVTNSHDFFLPFIFEEASPGLIALDSVASLDLLADTDGVGLPVAVMFEDRHNNDGRGGCIASDPPPAANANFEKGFSLRSRSSLGSSSGNGGSRLDGATL